MPPSTRPPVDEGLPLRLSVRVVSDRVMLARLLEVQPGFDVYVDGDRQRQVVSYDVAAGEVVVNALDERGRPMCNPERTGVQTMVVRGRVEVRWRVEPEGGG